MKTDWKGDYWLRRLENEFISSIWNWKSQSFSYWNSTFIKKTHTEFESIYSHSLKEDDEGESQEKIILKKLEQKVDTTKEVWKWLVKDDLLIK